MFFIGNFTVLDWYGWTNPNSCLLSYFNTNGNGESRNCGFTLLPIHFWKHIFFVRNEFGYDNVRIEIGLGFLSYFWDKPINVNSSNSNQNGNNG